jgi:hypothetical protein
MLRPNGTQLFTRDRMLPSTGRFGFSAWSPASTSSPSLAAEYPDAGAGDAESAPRRAVRVVRGCRLGRECIKYLGVISEFCQQDQGPPRTSPIEEFELDVLFHGDELGALRNPSMSCV